MSVECIEKYKQLNGIDILKVILKPTKRFPEGAYFYADACDEELVRSYAWLLNSQKQPYVVAKCYQYLCFHREKARNILDDYPDYINHVNGIEFDNVNQNLDKVTNQQNLWARPSKGYHKDKRFRSFEPYVAVNSRLIRAKCVRTEIEACQVAYQLELQYQDYRYDFLRDKHKDTDILDLERTGQISEDEAVYRHVLRYADNARFYFRYNLAEYFRDNHLRIPAFSLDSQGYMVSPITGQHLCPL